MVECMPVLFKIGDAVPQTGWYVCVPCGYTQLFCVGEVFLTCDACLAGTSDGPYGYEDPESEFWEWVGEER